MRIDLIIHGHSAKHWDIPEDNIQITESWSLQAKTEFRKAIIDRWLSSMRTAYADLIYQMGDKVAFQITLGSKVNTAEISDEEMKEFELLIQSKKQYAS